ncbi:MAG: tetratricopeptide repeat protein [Kofleriaceae bacterium]
MRTIAAALVVLLGCRAKEKPAPAVVAAPPQDGGSTAGSASEPSFALLRTGDGTRPATPEEALATLRANCDSATANNNNAVACFSLGQLYDTGTFVAKDSKLAMGLHDKACRLGEMRGCADLGVFYDGGTVVPRDASLAKKYFKQACDGGNGRGCNNVILLHPETATKEDIAYVIDRYRAICDGGGDAEACMSLGDAYRVGTYLPADAKRAVEFYAKACNAEHPTACNNLGAMHATGQGVAAKNDAEAAKLYAKACSLGSREGCINAGIDPETAPMQIKPNR